jgi:hypothetical protein
VSDGVGAGSEPGGSSSGFGTGALVATGLIALVIGAGGGYALGHSKGSDSGKEDSIAQGKAEEAAKYEAGTPAYRKIYNAGRTVGAVRGERRGDREGLRIGEREGKKVGFQKGEKVGIAEGERQGAVSGANAALGGLGDWESGTLYIVTTGAGSGVPTAITARHQMEPGNNYKLCKNNPQKLCESPQQ